jgi:hypothetical protein
MTKNWKKFRAGNFNFYFFDQKIAINLSLGLHKGCPSYRRSLQPSKENIQHFKTWKFCTFFFFGGHFCPPGSGSGFAKFLNADPDPATQVNADPDPQPCQKHTDPESGCRSGTQLCRTFLASQSEISISLNVGGSGS